LPLADETPAQLDLFDTLEIPRRTERAPESVSVDIQQLPLL
jgi:hypothetical protein